MILNGLVGHPSTWVLFAAAWLGLSALTALALGLIARVGQWRGNQR